MILATPVFMQPFENEKKRDIQRFIGFDYLAELADSPSLHFLDDQQPLCLKPCFSLWLPKFVLFPFLSQTLTN